MAGLLDRDSVFYRVFVHNQRHRERLCADYLDYIREVMAQIGIVPQQSVFWMYPYNDLAPALIDHLQPAAVVVDVVDDQRAWPNVSDARKARISENYRETLCRAHVALCNCEPVQAAMQPYFSDMRLIPNACDAQPPPVELPDALYQRLAQKQRPVIGFSGNLEKKMDLPLLEKIATTFTDAEIVLMGSSHNNPDILTLNQHAHVHFPGVVPYHQAGSWISLFDVALMPHLNMDLTRHMNPLKLYAYLTWHVPVVTTAIPNVDTSSGWVFVAQTHEAFIQHIRELLAKTVPLRELEPWRQANTWAARLQACVDDVVVVAREAAATVPLPATVHPVDPSGMPAEADDITELRQENELLLLQLYQVQEELEEYYLKYHELLDKGRGDGVR